MSLSGFGSGSNSRLESHYPNSHAVAALQGIDRDPATVGYTFDILVPNSDVQIHPAQALLDLDDYIDDRPETAATFPMADAGVPAYLIGDPAFALLAGTWRVPDRYVDLTRNRERARFVNPQHVHRARMADVVAECRCGAVIGQWTGHGDDGRDWEREHTDECNRLHASAAKAQLWHRRYHVLIAASLLYCRNGEYLRDRLGVKPGRRIRDYCRDVGIDRAGLLKQAKRELTATLVQLEPNFTTAELARIFHISKTSTYEWPKRYVSWTKRDDSTMDTNGIDESGREP